MQEHHQQRWRELCTEAAAEKDPKRLMELIAEINRLLGEEQRQLSQRGRDNSE